VENFQFSQERMWVRDIASHDCEFNKYRLNREYRATFDCYAWSDTDRDPRVQTRRWVLDCSAHNQRRGKRAEVAK
jgi:hypothetical protein